MQGRFRELGYIEGRDISFEFRWAEGKLGRLTQLASELAGLKVDVIIAFSTPAAISELSPSNATFRGFFRSATSSKPVA
jgi:putative ABC transport system substrate-binding protein